MTRLELKRSGDIFVRRIPRWKRAMDLVGASALLLAASPVMAFVAVYIKFVSRGPIIFKQDRVGVGGREFKMWKFRTMHEDVDTSGHQDYMRSLIRDARATDKPMIKRDDANPAIIPFGGLLRSSSIDELPQLINVLRGEMSLVGPRPVIPYEVEHFTPWHFGRFDVLPGLTGLWQVRGKNSLSFNEMVRLDVRYSRGLSLGLDLKILCWTPMVVIRQVANEGKDIPDQAANGDAFRIVSQPSRTAQVTPIQSNDSAR